MDVIEDHFSIGIPIPVYASRVVHDRAALNGVVVEIQPGPATGHFPCTETRVAVGPYERQVRFWNDSVNRTGLAIVGPMFAGQKISGLSIRSGQSRIDTILVHEVNHGLGLEAERSLNP